MKEGNQDVFDSVSLVCADDRGILRPTSRSFHLRVRILYFLCDEPIAKAHEPRQDDGFSKRMRH